MDPGQDEDDDVPAVPARHADDAAIAKARLIARAADDLKAENIVALDMCDLTAYADTFLIISGRSDRHTRAIADAVVHALREAGDEPLGIEGMDEGHWVLIDANDSVVHVFDPDTRELYDLERLWSDAPEIDLELPTSEDARAPGDD